MIRILLTCVLAVALAACVSSTSGPPQRQADNEDAAELNYQLGARYYRSGRYDLARDRLKLSLDFDSRRPLTWTALALTYEALANERLATDAYEQAIRVAPRSYDAHNAYAVYLCRQDEYDKAARHFDRAANVENNDDAEYTLTNAGVCMIQKPDFARAEEYFRRALDAKADHPEALLQLMELNIRRDNDLGARAFLQRYLAGSPADPNVLWTAIQLEGRLGNERAQRDYEDQLIREFPTSERARQILQSD